MLDTTKIRYIVNEDDARRKIEQLAQQPVLGVDIETCPKEQYRDVKQAALDPRLGEVRLISVAALDGSADIFDMHRLSFDVLKPLTAIPWVAFNAGFEHRFLSRAGLLPKRWHDLQLLDRLTSHLMHRNLADVVKEALNIDLDKSEQISDWSQSQLSDEQLRYAALDALVTIQGARELMPMMERAGQRKIYNTWCAALPVLADLQLRGQAFDWAAHEKLWQGWQQEKEQLTTELKQHLGDINLNSGPQLADWLQKNMDESTLQRWPKTPKGRLKTNADTFQLFSNHLAIAPLLRYKKTAKLLSTYGDKFAKHKHIETGKLHAEFRLGQTASGRVCAAKPNTQNPPRLEAFRALFVPEPGKVFIGADFSQIELRVAALLSNDHTMIDAYKRGDDLHRLTAAAVAGIQPDQVTKEQRTGAKAINFGNLYGQGPAGLAKQAQLDYGVAMTTEQAQAALNKFHQTYPALASWKRQQVALARQVRQVKTRLGLVRHFDIQGAGYLKGEAQNIPIQGSAAEILMCTLARLPEALQNINAKLAHNIHDEILIEVEPSHAEAAATALQQAMTEGFLDVFPEGEALTAGLVDVQQGDNWAAVH